MSRPQASSAVQVERKIVWLDRATHANSSYRGDGRCDAAREPDLEDGAAGVSVNVFGRMRTRQNFIASKCPVARSLGNDEWDRS